MASFLDIARAELRLNGQEVEYLLANRVRSFDWLHGLLLASPDIQERIRGVRRADLMRALEPLLSDAYRRALAGPPREFTPMGATLSLPPLNPGIADSPPPADWPGLGKEDSLKGLPEIDLRAGIQGWPVRHQGGQPTCVAFAATAALELFQLRRGGPPLQRLSPIFLYALVREMMVERAQGAPLPAGAEHGAIWLTDAAAVLELRGTCPDEDWPANTALKDRPGPAVLAKARPSKVDRWDLGRLTKRWPAPARAVWELLSQGRPVAITMPEFQPPPSGGKAPTNWGDWPARTSGEVPDPPVDYVKAPSGHAVCVVGFQKDDSEELGGWFIFRNSLGEDFATTAPNFSDETPPVIPDTGYGALSARHLNHHVYEIMAPR